MNAVPTPTIILLMGTSVPLPVGSGLPAFVVALLGFGLAVSVASILRIVGVVKSTMALLSLILMLTVLPASIYLTSVGWQTASQAEQEIEAKVKVNEVTTDTIKLDISLSQPALVTASYGEELDKINLISFAEKPAAVATEHQVVIDDLKPNTLYYLRIEANSNPIGEVLQVKTK